MLMAKKMIFYRAPCEGLDGLSQRVRARKFWVRGAALTDYATTRRPVQHRGQPITIISIARKELFFEQKILRVRGFRAGICGRRSIGSKFFQYSSNIDRGRPSCRRRWTSQDFRQIFLIIRFHVTHCKDEKARNCCFDPLKVFVHICANGAQREYSMELSRIWACVWACACVCACACVHCRASVATTFDSIYHVLCVSVACLTWCV